MCLTLAALVFVSRSASIPRLVTGDAVAEITRLKAEDDGPMGIGGATLAGAVMWPG